MPDHENYSVTATLVPGAGTSSLLRIVSILHSRGALIHELTFRGDQRTGARLTALVSSSNVGRETVAACLRRAVDTVDVAMHESAACDFTAPHD